MTWVSRVLAPLDVLFKNREKFIFFPVDDNYDDDVFLHLFV